MHFDIYGRFVLDIERVGDGWELFRCDLGKRVPFRDIAIPKDLPAEKIIAYLDDLFHESASRGKSIRRMEEGT